MWVFTLTSNGAARAAEFLFIVEGFQSVGDVQGTSPKGRRRASGFAEARSLTEAVASSFTKAGGFVKGIGLLFGRIVNIRSDSIILSS
ncbi:hypothetical protein DPMN_065099 [Dreissena polymorpha]|uniref:Uncharacterized protein n=1 Tax=Dreissena polymorpha TaxID=45954 RepID=A0A9D4CEK3_DREPO|nr:hypothetical protein DPMN_065099 [Dreissena polymorpha]